MSCFLTHSVLLLPSAGGWGRSPAAAPCSAPSRRRCFGRWRRWSARRRSRSCGRCWAGRHGRCARAPVWCCLCSPTTRTNPADDWTLCTRTTTHRTFSTSYRPPPRGRRDDMPLPMAVRPAADLRPSADRSAVRIWLSCRQPACL